MGLLKSGGRLLEKGVGKESKEKKEREMNLFVHHHEVRCFRLRGTMSQGKKLRGAGTVEYGYAPLQIDTIA